VTSLRVQQYSPEEHGKIQRLNYNAQFRDLIKRPFYIPQQRILLHVNTKSGLRHPIVTWQFFFWPHTYIYHANTKVGKVNVWNMQLNKL
jgi:hypothetical protein